MKTWSAGEVLTASDLNAEYNNILNNSASLISPATATWDLNANELVLDLDGDTSITSDTDDQIDIKIGGTDRFYFTASGLIFEGATADTFETTLAVTDPTADRTWTFQDATDTVVGRATTDTLTNKSVNLANNTVTGTTAEFNTALSDGSFATLAGVETLTNKTLTAPVLSGTVTGTYTLGGTPTFPSTLVTTDTTQTITGDKTFSTTGTSPPVIITSTDAGATSSPILRLFRDSASPAVSDIIGQIGFRGRDSGAAAQDYAFIHATINDPTAASEDATLIFTLVSAGSLVESAKLAAGLQLGSPTGGDKGAGTLNAAANIYVNNDPVVTDTSTSTLTNKTLTAPVLGGTVTGTYTIGGTPTFPSTVVLTTGAQTLTDKTLTAPVIATIVNTGTLTLPTATDTLVARDTTDTLTNKTITAPVLSGTATGTYTLGGTPTFPSTVVLTTGAQTLTDKTLTSPVINSATGISQSVVVRKTADESITSSTTLQDDDHLLFAIAANEEWVAEFFLYVGDNLSLHGLKVAVTTPSGATQEIDAVIESDNGTNDMGRTTTSGGTIDFTTTDITGTTGFAQMSVWVLNGATPGSITLQFAQSTSNGTAAKLRKGSHLIAHRVA